ncbi:MAG: saccharopine dehydrogenase NADP-binding domain-containing protein [Xanthomonadales bacterium]|nr:saccharopine dehydrogenase NADP-binding domain-containing protein [Xanthomonadales bacterium]
MEKQWMIYGANGYTGRLAAERARDTGMSPILAGRNAGAVEALANELGLESRVFSLDEAADRLEDVSTVLHCAGPFSATARPMMEACLQSKTHYLDITGEISVFQTGHGYAAQAEKTGICLCPGVGFDVVPTDCLAARLHQEMPDATELVLAFEAGGGPSPGTAKTSIEGLGKGGMIRRDGELVVVPLAHDVTTIDFGQGPRTAMTIPWGDVYTAYVSTGIPGIRVYMSVPPSLPARLRRLRWLQPVLGSGMVQGFLKSRVEKSVRGPDADRRENTQSRVWGQVRNASGEQREALMLTPNGYELTVTASLGVVKRLLAREAPAGFHTPSSLMGAHYAESLPGVSLTFS